MKWWLSKLFPGESASTPTARLGRWGEGIAAEHLRREGYFILGRNVRVPPHGEIDLVARKEGTLAFVEVKTRRDERYIRPADAVNAEKRRNISRAVRGFLRKASFPGLLYRCDIVEVVGLPEQGAPLVRHLAGTQLVNPDAHGVDLKPYNP
ncbi:MAG: YraN family protein [Kiritimatiellia bacterium]